MILPCYSRVCLLTSWHQLRDVLEKGLLPKLRARNEYMVFSKHRTACEIIISVPFYYTFIRLLYHFMYFIMVAQTLSA